MQGSGLLIRRSFPLAVSLSDAADEMTNCRYIDSLRRTSGPYRSPSVPPRTPTVGKEGIMNTVSIDRITLSPTLEQVNDSLHKQANITGHDMREIGDGTMSKTRKTRQKIIHCSARVRGKLHNVSYEYCGY